MTDDGQPNLRKEERDEHDRCEGCGKGWPHAIQLITLWALVLAAVCYLASIGAL